MPRKTTTRKNIPADQCPACEGEGTTARPVTVRVGSRFGRQNRTVGQQDGICLTCLGTGTAPESDS